MTKPKFKLGDHVEVVCEGYPYMAYIIVEIRYDSMLNVFWYYSSNSYRFDEDSIQLI